MIWQIRDTRPHPSSDRLDLTDMLPGTPHATISPWHITSHLIPKATRLSTLLSPDSFGSRYVGASHTTPLLPPLPTLFHAAPTLPEWARVERQPCQIPQAPGPMIFAHPLDDQTLRLTWNQLRLGKKLLVFGGIESPVVRWGMADVTVKVTLTLSATPQLLTHTLELENRPGIRGLIADTTSFAGAEASLAIELTTPDAAQRWVCIDGVVIE